MESLARPPIARPNRRAPPRPDLIKDRSMHDACPPAIILIHCVSPRLGRGIECQNVPANAPAPERAHRALMIRGERLIDCCTAVVSTRTAGPTGWLFAAEAETSVTPPTWCVNSCSRLIDPATACAAFSTGMSTDSPPASVPAKTAGKARPSANDRFAARISPATQESAEPARPGGHNIPLHRPLNVDQNPLNIPLDHAFRSDFQRVLRHHAPLQITPATTAARKMELPLHHRVLGDNRRL